MSKKIVVGFDGSPESSDALRWAADEAVARGSSLEMVSCYQIPVTGDMYTAWTPTVACADLMQSVSEVAVSARDAIRATHPTIDISSRVSAGVPAEELAAASDGAELVVVGASSHHGVAAFWLGSTPRSVARRSTCPVVVVRGALARGGPDRIVVGVDDSEQAVTALLWAAAEADLHHVTLLVVHAWDHPYEVSDRASSQARDLMRVDAARLLDRTVELARDLCGGDVKGELVEASPGTAILGAVRDGDLLVLGSRGRGALTAGLFGSTVNRVLDEATTPVAVVRHAPDN